MTIPDGIIITSITPTGPNVLVRFTSQAGKYYRIQYTDSLSPPNWLTAVEFVAGTGDIVEAMHSGGAGQSLRCYRVKQLTTLEVLPLANFVGNPTAGQVPLTVTFVDHSSGWVTNRFWNFGDGTTANTTSAVVTHTYTTPATNTVSMLASGPLGASAQTRPDYIVVNDGLRITDIQFAGTNVLISFTSQADKYYRVEYTDGLAGAWVTAADLVPGTGNIVQAVHTNGAGSALRLYRVKLLGNTDMMPSANFGGTPTSGIAPLTVTFVDNSSGWVTNRFLEFW